MTISVNALTTKLEELESKRSSRVGMMVVKVDINTLKKEVAEMKSTDITSLWGSMDVPLEAIDVTLRLRVENEYIVSFLESNEEVLGVDILRVEHGELMAIEEAIIVVITKESL